MNIANYRTVGHDSIVNSDNYAVCDSKRHQEDGVCSSMMTANI
ncbi:hypothetical protein [Photobacterium aquimaris]|nr:hypothetical protein [Photobacterium aquimaris]